MIRDGSGPVASVSFPLNPLNVMMKRMPRKASDTVKRMHGGTQACEDNDYPAALSPVL
jgi:hypothetical protein